jgi:hypothetical protein
MFDVGATMEKCSWALIISELSFFQRLSILPSMCANSFAWWQNHEGQFSNVNFLAKRIFGILKF